MAKDKKHLIIGADGYIGGQVLNHLNNENYETLSTTRRISEVNSEKIFLDLSSNVENFLLPTELEAAYLCAGPKNISICEDKKELMHLTHVNNTVKIAEKISQSGGFIVGLSSIAVFNGNESYYKSDHSYSPANEYGRQRCDFEMQMNNKIGENHAIVRFCKIFRKDLPILKEWKLLWKNNKPIRPFNDLIIAPVPITTISDIIVKAGQRKINTIFNVSGKEDVSYADIANLLAKRLSLPSYLVQPISSFDAGIDLHYTPQHSTLDMSITEDELGISAPNIHDIIEYIAPSFES